MTGPLVVLGVLTVLGGALNVPELFGGTAYLERWLEPVTSLAHRLQPAVEVANAREWALVAGAGPGAAPGVLRAVPLLQPGTPAPARRPPPPNRPGPPPLGEGGGEG